MLECISFASAAAKGPEPRWTSIFVNNYVDFLFSPNRPYRPYLSHITDRPSLGWRFTVVFTYNYVENFFSPNRPYRPSLSQNENRPSFGGVYCRKNPRLRREKIFGFFFSSLSGRNIPEKSAPAAGFGNETYRK